jgi:uracil-DNA glycosylase
MHPRKQAVLAALDIPLWAARSQRTAEEPQPEAYAPISVTLAEPATSNNECQPGDVSVLPSQMDWRTLEQAVAQCTRCGLCKARTQTVFGTGSRTARWMIVGEAPGAEEDARGEPFVGQAGRLLANMLAAIGLARDQVFIANVLKCRPPGNRNPEPNEVAQCSPYLARQLDLVNPGLVLVLGRFAAQSLLQTDASIASLRGRVLRVHAGEREIPAVVSYHPAYLLRNLPDKAKSWADLNLAKQTLAPLA